MSVMRSLLFLFVAGLLGCVLPSSAHAALRCWMAGHAYATFGEVTSGSSPSQPFEADIQCDNSQTGDEKVRWVRVCLSMNTEEPIMRIYWPESELKYNIYKQGEPSSPIGPNHYAWIDMQLAAHQSGQKIPLVMMARILPNQYVAAGDYRDDSGTVIRMIYDFEENQSSLPSCGSDMNGEEQLSSVSASATVVNGCELINVDPMNFGNKSHADGSQLQGNAVSGITLRCPTNTTYTVAIDMGQNRSGSTRRMCNSNNECVSYGLYQDYSFSVPWDDSANTLTETSTTGQEQAIPVYGQVPPQTWPTAGEYEDTVVVTLSY